MARRGYGCRLGVPVVEGTGVDLARLGQGSYAPVRVIGMVRLNRFRHGRTNVLLPRAHFSPKNRDRRSARGIALSRPMESGAFRCSEKAAPLSIACERSEVLTALQCRALQLYAVFWGMRHKNVKHRSKTTNGIHHAGGAVQQRSLAGNPRKFRESRTRTMGECGGMGETPKPAAPLSAAAGSGRGRYDYPLCKEVCNAFVCRTLSVLS